ncbi:MAG: type II toxin-antitoxin system Phd/YefM family antitoxin [Limisphaerales bacterium]
MKTITIRELHVSTGRWVRQAAHHGQILVTFHGRTVARIVPEAKVAAVPYFARRKFVSPALRKLVESGKLGRGGTDSTMAISEDREDRS